MADEDKGPDNGAESNPDDGTGSPGPADQGNADTGSQSDTEPADPSKREAALRQRVKTAESGLTEAQATITGLHRAEAIRLAGGTLANGDDMFALGTAELADLLTEDGKSVDPEKVTAAAEAVVAARGEHFRARKPQKQHGAGGSGGRTAVADQYRSGGQLIKDSLGDHGHPQRDGYKEGVGTKRY